MRTVAVSLLALFFAAASAGCGDDPRVQSATPGAPVNPPQSDAYVIGLDDGDGGSSGFCAAMDDGAYCDMGILIVCLGGAETGSTECPSGCIKAPGDLPDVCAVPPDDPDSFCAEKAKGEYCNFNTLTTCAGGAQVGATPCPLGCSDEGGAHCVSQESDEFCASKADGAWCAGDALVSCQDGKISASYPCALGCVPAPPGEPDACSSEENAGFCEGLADTAHCDADMLFTCAGGAVVGTIECLHGCVQMPGDQPDICGPGSQQTWCSDKADGAWCKGDAVVQCSGDEIVGEEACPFGCVGDQGGAACAQPDDSFCEGKQNGAWCNGESLATCKDGVIATQFACPWGCLSMPAGTPDECVAGGFCTDVPGKSSPSPPSGACAYMDWKLSPDGFYLNSKFGTTNDPTTLGNSTSCGFLQGQYNANGCIYDKQTGKCLDGDKTIPWVHGHVDWSYEQVISAVSANMDGDVPFGQFFYVAGAQRFNCGTLLRVSNPQNGRCITVYAEDGGPGSKYESAPYGGRRILDASPAVVQYLQLAKTGWKSSDLVYVEWGLDGDAPGKACTPCTSSPAKQGNDAPKSPFDLLHMVPSCGSSGGDGGGSCPSGNGLYCGSGPDLDANTLYLCQNGNYTPHEQCANGCQQNDPGVNDSCTAGPDGGGECPSGDGLYCGGPVGKDSNTLYFCSGGNFDIVESCANGCQENPPGTQDACKDSTPNPGGKLVMCNPFKPSKPVTCGFGCYSGHKGSDYSAGNGTPVYAPIAGKVTKKVDTVTGQTCAPNFGSYVKIQQGAYEVILAHMNADIPVSKDQDVTSDTQVGKVSNTGYTLSWNGSSWVCQQGGGYHLHMEVRKNGVAFDAYTSGDVVWSDSCKDAGPDIEPGPSCPSGNGAYCGGTVGKDANKLYNCSDGSYTVIQTCANGCQTMPAGQADKCKDTDPGPSCPSGNGLYCGGSVGKDANKLYNCSNGNYTVAQDCANGCQTMPAGTSDKCKDAPQPTCPNGNGKYCGGSVGKDSNKLYNCTDGSYSVAQDCSNGCQVMPPGTNDKCKDPPQASCPSGNGLYCGGPVGKDSKTLYNCSGGSYTFSAYCSAGCNVAPPGQNDSCKSGSCPSGNGAYCGQSVGLDSNSLFNCSNGKYTVKQKCNGQCKVAPPGQPDTC